MITELAELGLELLAGEGRLGVRDLQRVEVLDGLTLRDDEAGSTWPIRNQLGGQSGSFRCTLRRSWAQ